MRFLSLVALAACTAFASNASAQMIYQQVPFQNLGSSFYEQNGVTWNLRGPGFFANFGGGVVPPFGNFDPNAGLRTGAAFSKGGVSGNIGFNFNQGSNRTNVSTTPSVTTMNGYPGSISDQTLRPFVTSISPVVGNRTLIPAQAPQPASQQLLNAYQASQQAELRERFAANNSARQKKALASYNRGLRAEEEGNLKMARANYRNALGSAQGELRVEILKKIRARGW